ncbi:MAG: MerR family transcriptional regulator [Deltaproteobacteria bacterium]|nr:MerR family transcriptional regulator [Deltaproteobacteria bacterium]
MARRAISKIQDPKPIPDRLYFKIGEVAQIVGVEPYVLRYWETEFPTIAPGKRRGQRRYKKEEVEKLLVVRSLLYDRKFTIEGARTYLETESKSPKQDSSPNQQQLGLNLASNQGVAELKRNLVEKLKELEAIF